MRNKGLIILAVVLGLLFLVSFVYAEEKVACVDLGQIFEGYKKTKEYDKILEQKQKAYEKEREGKLEEVKKFQEKLSLLSEEEREARRSELEDKITQIQEFDRSKTQDLRKQRDERVREIFDNIKKTIDDYAKKEGFTLIFDKRALVFSDDSLDITDQISKSLNK